jgi:multiple sugar transport system substrate-binding protein
MMIQLLRQSGGDYSTAEGDVLMFNDTTRQILRTVAEQAAKGTFSTFKIESYPANFLNRGQCIFAIDSTAGATWMGADAPLVDVPPEQMVDFETVVYPVPQLDPEHPQMISQGPSMCIFNKADPQEVLASWLFMQFMLTDEVQIAYSQTEGYAPVTSKAQQSDVYQDYLSRAGEDGDLHYSIKLDAVKLLLDNTDNTFVTPVFNGSASLRNAAGQMIEEVTKAVRRGRTVDEAFLSKLETDMVSLYRLDQFDAVTVGRQELGPLPSTAVALLGALGVAWVCIGCAYLLGRRKAKK